MLLEGLEAQIVVGEVENKSLDNLDHAGRGDFHFIHTKREKIKKISKKKKKKKKK